MLTLIYKFFFRWVRKATFRQFHWFVHWELVETLLEDIPAFYLVVIQSFLNFLPIPRIRSHYESAESAESWENFVLLPDKKLDDLLTELKLVPNVQNSEKLNQTSFYLKDKNRGHRLLITRDCSNTYIWLLVIFSLDIWNLSYKSS